MRAGGDRVARWRGGLSWNREPLDGSVPRTQLVWVISLALLSIGLAATAPGIPLQWVTASVFAVVTFREARTTARAVRLHGWEPLAPGDRLGAPSRSRLPEAD